MSAESADRLSAPVGLSADTPVAALIPLHRLARDTVAGWPTPHREDWGRRADALQGEGLGWREAEARAFQELIDSPGDVAQAAGPATSTGRPLGS